MDSSEHMLRELYQEVIIDHNRHPRNRYEMEAADRSAEGYNPLCGDELQLFLKLENDRIQEASFTGCGCAISTASASIMTDMLRGKSIADAEQLFHAFHNAVVEKQEVADKKALGKLEILLGVKAYPARVKCATLAWHTLDAALQNKADPVTTELGVHDV